MRVVESWLQDYSDNHQNPVNQRFHFVCVPIIVFSVIAALKSIPLGNAWLNPATFVVTLALIYYFVLSWRLALGLLLILLGFYAGVLCLESFVAGNLIWYALGIFIVGWIGQFIGHAIEGTRPSFFKDIQFLLIGPLWELAQFYRWLGLRIN